jgi:hypothetical protein
MAEYRKDLVLLVSRYASWQCILNLARIANTAIQGEVFCLAALRRAKNKQK